MSGLSGGCGGSRNPRGATVLVGLQLSICWGNFYENIVQFCRTLCTNILINFAIHQRSRNQLDAVSVNQPSHHFGYQEQVTLQGAKEANSLQAIACFR